MVFGSHGHDGSLRFPGRANCHVRAYTLCRANFRSASDIVERSGAMMLRCKPEGSMQDALKIAAVFVTLASFVSTDSARAYGACDDLVYEKRENDGKKADLIARYPGTMITLLGCAGYAAS